MVLLAVQFGAAQNRKPIVRQVDHILIETSAPKALFDLFTDELHLPAAWAVTTYPGSVTGGVGAGNTILEVFQYGQDRGAPGRSAKARFLGLALQPYPLTDVLPELKSRGIPFAPPQTQVSTLPDGSQGTAWTTIILPALGRGMSVFLYEYNPKFLNVEVRRKQLAGELTLSRGGPLGIRGVKEIVIRSSRLEADQSEWKKLLAPATPQTLAGPAIHLVPGSTDGIQAIVFQVRSLAQARAFLKSRRWLGADSGSEVTIRPLAVQGLNIRLVEK